MEKEVETGWRRDIGAEHTTVAWPASQDRLERIVVGAARCFT